MSYFIFLFEAIWQHVFEYFGIYCLFVLVCPCKQCIYVFHGKPQWRCRGTVVIMQRKINFSLGWSRLIWISLSARIFPGLVSYYPSCTGDGGALWSCTAEKRVPKWPGSSADFFILVLAHQRAASRAAGGRSSVCWMTLEAFVTEAGAARHGVDFLAFVIVISTCLAGEKCLFCKGSLSAGARGGGCQSPVWWSRFCFLINSLVFCCERQVPAHKAVWVLGRHAGRWLLWFRISEVPRFTV